MKEFLDCHEEEIHIPGHIQSYGYLIGLDAETKTIKFYSQNIATLFQIEGDIFGAEIESLPQSFSQIAESELYQNLEKFTQKENDYFVDKIIVNGIPHHFLIYKFSGNIFLEFERFIDNNSQKVYLSNKYANPSSLLSSEEIWKNLARLIYDVVGYDRIMVYRFLEDGTGKVIAEHINPGLESYMNLHYPESDIPRQARALYLKKRERIFSDVYSEMVPIFSKTDEKIDLTYSSVRAMSPIHGQYLKNTGVASSFSTSIIIDNQLWGLVTCQNVEAKHIDLTNRIRAEVFTALAANSYMSFKSQQKIDDINEFNNKTRFLREQFLKHNTLKDSLFENIEVLKNMVESDGLAIIMGNGLKTFGTVPAENAIRKIGEWMQSQPEKMFYSNSFLKDFKEQFDVDQNAAGVFIANLDSLKTQMLIWFRKEYTEHINWAGYEEKKPETVNHYGTEKIMISPRKSFEIFSEDINGKSKHWQDKNIIAVEKLIPVILETSINQSSKIVELNDQLKKLNEELDSFSHTISHDLGTPLTVMKLNAQLLERTQKENPDVQKKVKKIIEEINGMEVMMRNVLDLSRAKTSEIHLENMETLSLIDKIMYDAKFTLQAESTEVIKGDCPNVLADKTMLKQVLQNVIGNAIKYSSKSESPKVEIHGEVSGESVIYKIKDNGIGIADKNNEKMFKIFSRMENAKSFQGNGVGLSIVYRLMKRLGGNISFESKVNEGTTFILTFQKP